MGFHGDMAISSRRLLAPVVLGLLVLAAAPAVAQEPPPFPFVVVETWRAEDPATVVVEGSYTCGPFTSNGGVVDLTIRQGAGAAARTGYGYAAVGACDGTSQPFRTVVGTVDGLPWDVGPARLLASGYVCDVRGPCQNAIPVDTDVYLDQVGPTFDFTVRTVRRSADPRVLSASGTYRCGPFDTGESGGGVVDLSVRQGRGAGEVTGSGFAYPTTCDGTTRTWRATVRANGPAGFRRGAAIADASGYVTGQDELGGTVGQTPAVLGQPIRIR